MDFKPCHVLTHIYAKIAEMPSSFNVIGNNCLILLAINKPPIIAIP